jgi:hypothetical protein
MEDWKEREQRCVNVDEKGREGKGRGGEDLVVVRAGSILYCLVL